MASVYDTRLKEELATCGQEQAMGHASRCDAVGNCTRVSESQMRSGSYTLAGRVAHPALHGAPQRAWSDVHGRLQLGLALTHPQQKSNANVHLAPPPTCSSRSIAVLSIILAMNSRSGRHESSRNLQQKRT